MKINVHAGHNPAGMVAAGAVGIKDESDMNREVADYLIQYLLEAGHTVYNCTVNDGTSQQDVLNKIVKKCNSHDVDWDISIHHNAYQLDHGDGRVKGCEAYVFTEGGEESSKARSIMDKLEELGFPTRGVYGRSELAVLRNTKAKAILIECCFCDDADDVNIWNPSAIAAAIMEGLTGDIPAEVEPTPSKEGKWYRVQTGAFKDKANALNMVNELKKIGYPDAYIQEY